jgi:hypothetical protein
VAACCLPIKIIICRAGEHATEWVPVLFRRVTCGDSDCQLSQVISAGRLGMFSRDDTPDDRRGTVPIAVEMAPANLTFLSTSTQALGLIGMARGTVVSIFVVH